MAEDKKKSFRPKTLLHGILLVLNVLMAIGLVASAYAGWLSPARFAFAGLLSLTFPIWIVAAVVMAVIDLIFWRKSALLIVVALVCTAGPIHDFFPLNFTKPSVTEAEEARSFTLLTYNVFAFTAKNGVYPDSINATMEYVINSGADIVGLQEARNVEWPHKALYISSAQCDTLKKIYPHRKTFHSTTVLSKYPFEVIEIARDSVFDDAVLVCDFELFGKKVRLYNMHLESFGLTDEDKMLYRELTEFEGRGKAGEVKEQLIDKLVAANRRRALQAQALRKVIRENPVKTTIICGDFNDVPNSYSLHVLEDMGFMQVYPKVGLGPIVTYNSDRLLFHIDHVLYRGQLKPLSLYRHKIRSSDHYPQLVTFCVE